MGEGRSAFYIVVEQTLFTTPVFYVHTYLSVRCTLNKFQSRIRVVSK